MQSSLPTASAEDILHLLNLDREEDYEVDLVLRTLDELETAELIERNGNPFDDSIMFIARPGLKWSEFNHIDEPIKKTILLLLVENPKTFFVLQNTQSGKMRICALEMNQWSERTDIKPVAFFITQNDRTLTEQSVDGLTTLCGNCKIFTLSSNSKQTYEDIKSYVDAYAADEDGEYKMPIIAALANDTQNRKILTLLAHILRKVRRNSRLRYSMIFDEADDTYPKLRKMSIRIDDVPMCYSQFIVDNDDALHRIGFVSATEGELLEEDFPECANAYLYPVDHAGNMYYRAAHHPDSEFRIEPVPSKMTNNAYAEKLIDDHLAYFTTPNGTYFRKIIVNSNAKSSDMTSLARFANSRGFHALIFNMYGIKTYISGESVQTFRTKGRRFSEVLFEVYKSLKLEDKPLLIIGRRKVDRGLGFHYAPRDGSEGLIWTDIILGKIEDVHTAVQKAGRLAGIIAQCPQYYGKCTYWTDEHTQRDILRHNTIVDEANKLTGCTTLQAVTRGTEKVNAFLPEFTKPPKEVKPPKPSKPKTDPTDFAHVVFDLQEDAIVYAKEQFGITLRKRVDAIASEGFQCNGQNPTLEEIQRRQPGLGQTSFVVRMVPNIEKQWVVYWRPSLAPQSKI
jgi:hypothetical protein|uniref:Uncharacterized protein n=1 Tax=viral metagenome TaxID=1070528 RepID=A0A6C0AGV4_9ZZZZ